MRSGIVDIMKNRKIFALVGLVALFAAIALINFTAPSEVGPIGVLTFFLLSYVSVTSLFYLLIGLVSGVMISMLPAGRLKLTFENLPERKIYYYASIIGLAPIIILGMMSVGDITVMDVFLILIFEAIGCFYIAKRF